MKSLKGNNFLSMLLKRRIGYFRSVFANFLTIFYIFHWYAYSPISPVPNFFSIVILFLQVFGSLEFQSTKVNPIELRTFVLAKLK